MKYIVITGVVSLFLSLIRAEALTVQVTTPDGKPVANAVVIAETGPMAVSADDFDWPVMMEQVDLEFAPYVLIAPVGSKVTFPNRDRVRHHVYSFSKGNQFEIELYGRDDSRFQIFSTPGIVAVGCNIHDNMIGYIRIVETPFAAKTNEDGEVHLAGLPDTVKAVRIWHPDMTGTADDTVRTLTGASMETVQITVSEMHMDHDHH